MQGALAMDYLMPIGPEKGKMIHMIAIGTANEKFILIMSIWTFLYLFLLMPVFLIASKNGVRIDELDKKEQELWNEKVKLRDLKAKYTKLIENG